MKITGAIFIPFFIMAVSLPLLYECKQSNNKEEPFFLNLNDTVNYVGIQKCRECHSDHYETFIETGMGKSFGKATADRSAAKFNQLPVYDSKNDMYYLAEKRGNKIFITEFRLSGSDTVHRRTEEIKYIVGSGHHTNSHFWESNGYIFQAPLTWYSQKARWDLPPGFETYNSGFNRKIDIECMSCHNAIPEVASGSINRFTVLKTGIDCERCHGPGELHVKLKSEGVLVDTRTETDRSIVNPSRLPWKLQVDVCQRCHLQGNNVLKPGKAFTDFRPGMALKTVFDVFMPVGKGDFFMADHTERLQMSACFKGSNTGSSESYNPKLNFTCITCHNPHVSVQKTSENVYNNACKNCHHEGGKSRMLLCVAPEKDLVAQNNNCVKCHMPSRGAEDIPHVSVHDHYIRRDYNQKTTLISESKLYAVNDINPDKLTEIKGYITWYEKFSSEKSYLNQADKLIQKAEKDADILIHFYYANAQWSSIIAISKNEKIPKDAWTYYRIAKAYDRSNELKESIEWYRMAKELQPENPDFTAEYGNALVRTGRSKEAYELLKKSALMFPKYPLILTNLGIAAINTDKITEGIIELRKSIALEPDQQNAHAYLKDLYEKLGDERNMQKESEEITRIHGLKGNLSF